MDIISGKSIETNKSFWNFIKSFMKNKGMIASNDNFNIREKCHHSEYEISMTVNKHYINIAEKQIIAAETNLIK